MYGSFDAFANAFDETPSDLIEYYRKASGYDEIVSDASGFGSELDCAPFESDWGECYGE